MAKPVNWDALRRVFQPDAPGADDETAIYNGEEMPRWLALDLADERAAIMEFSGGMSREEADGHVFCELKHN